MSGDLEGVSRWSMVPEGAGTRATFEEVVTVRKLSLRRLAFLARPFFRLNHSVMMRHWQRGLPTYLAGHRAGFEQVPRARHDQGSTC
jgi:hypothetical protein